MAARGCGSRLAGGVYAELGLSPGGSPLEDFMICPPIPIRPEALGLSARGVKLIQQGETWHVIDWVGTNHYPNPTDDLEEIRRMGMSARLELASADEYAKLGPGSRILRAHAHAYISFPADRQQYWAQRKGDMTRLGYEWNLCPKHVEEHIRDPFFVKQEAEPPMCIGLLYEDLILGRPLDGDQDERAVIREMPSFEYRGYRAPEFPLSHEPDYSPAIYASFPIQRLVVVADQAAGTHQQKAEKLAKSSLFDPETGVVPE